MPKIFGIGLSRTGTSSLHYALQLLGFSSVHQPTDLAAIAAHDAASDMAVAFRYRLLDQMYPGARFILTERDLDSWLESCRFHYTRRMVNERLAEPWRSFREEFLLSIFGTVDFDAERYTAGYLRHRQAVIDHFRDRPGDLLVINLCNHEGWEKLCPFLGVPIPRRPFPHVNRTWETTSARALEVLRP